jgi:ATP-dependent Clp protease ATP-binding subunit ClpX
MDTTRREPPFYPELRRYLARRIRELERIPAARRRDLRGLAALVRDRLEAGESLRLVFICTHNSRRSQIARLWAQAAAHHYGVTGVETFSGGTEATAFEPRAVAALCRAGFRIERVTEGENPVYEVRVADSVPARSPRTLEAALVERRRAQRKRLRQAPRPADYNAGVAGLPTPTTIAETLGSQVIGQQEAVREISVALAKKLAGLRVGNVLLIGSSGSGKTTLMRAVEGFLASNPELALRSTAVRIHANILGEEAERGHPGEKLLRRLLDRARQQLGAETPIDRLVTQATHGLVFVDEVDKIRSVVGSQPNVAGIRAQEALLTLIENESVPFRLPEWAGGSTVNVDSRSLLFVCAGAFEGLYDAVLHRVTEGRDKGSLKPVTVVDPDGSAREELPFSLRAWLKSEDLFEYGVTPQFLSRFDAVVLLEPLGEEELLRIFKEDTDSGLLQSQRYFAAFRLRLEVTEQATRQIAREAARQPRLGARALKEVFRRVVAPLEFDPRAHAGPDGVLRIDVGEVAEALARSGRDGEAAGGGAGWQPPIPPPSGKI